MAGGRTRIAEEVLMANHIIDHEVPLDIVLHMPGGLALASLRIALASDEIVMGEGVVLGPVNPHLVRRHSTVEYLPVPRHKEVKGR
jgi:membrane-bound ClpP family serine protease